MARWSSRTSPSTTSPKNHRERCGTTTATRPLTPRASRDASGETDVVEILGDAQDALPGVGGDCPGIAQGARRRADTHPGQPGDLDDRHLGIA